MGLVEEVQEGRVAAESTLVTTSYIGSSWMDVRRCADSRIYVT